MFYDPRDGIANQGHGCIGEDNGWDRVWTAKGVPAGAVFDFSVEFCQFTPPYDPYLGQSGPGFTGFFVFVDGGTAHTEEPKVNQQFYGETITAPQFCVVGHAWKDADGQEAGWQPGTVHPGLVNGGKWPVRVTSGGGDMVLRIYARMAHWTPQTDFCPGQYRDIDPPSDIVPGCMDPRLTFIKSPDKCWYDDLPNRPYLP